MTTLFDVIVWVLPALVGIPGDRPDHATTAAASLRPRPPPSRRRASSAGPHHGPRGVVRR